MSHYWKSMNLADACVVFTDGNWIESKDQSSEGIRLVQTGNIGTGFFKDREEKSRWITDDTFNRLKCFEIHPGDCLISRLPDPVGRACILPETGSRMITAVDCSIANFHKDILLPEFFIYYSQSSLYLNKVRKQCTGATRSRISRKNLGLVSVPIPPLSEQRRIVAILDDAFERIDTAIANTEKNIANAKELFESYLNNTYENISPNSKEVLIGEICESIVDCVNKTAPVVVEETPFKMIRTTNIKRGKVNLDNVKFVSEDTYKQWTRRQVPQLGDVLLTREAPMGEIGLLLSDDNVFLGQRIVSYRVDKSKVDNWFLYYALQTLRVQEQMRKVASGATVQHIRVPDTGKWLIRLPDLTVQKAVTKRLDSAKEAANSLELTNINKLASLQALKQSLLAAAFSGELTSDFNPDALEH